MTIHAFETGWLTANRTFLRGEGLLSLARRAVEFEFPVLAFAIEHADGLIVIDTGLAPGTPAPRRLNGFPPKPCDRQFAGLGDSMRVAGLDPDDVRLVILTHLDWDHTGGLAEFPHAGVVVSRDEWRFANSRLGRLRCRPELWPERFSPTLVDLEPEPFGPFATSLPVTRDGAVRLVPLPGHSPGQVGVVYESAGGTVLFAADHMLRADWFAEDIAARRLVMLGAFAKRASRRTSRRLSELADACSPLVLPAHDAQAPERLRAWRSGQGQAGVGRPRRELQGRALEDAPR